MIKLYLGVAQLVARYLGVVEAVGSSPVTQTIIVSAMIQCKKCTLERGCIFSCLGAKSNDYKVKCTQNDFGMKIEGDYNYE